MNPPKDPEFARFKAALGSILKVSKTELNRRLEAEKAEKKRKAKPSASRASAASSKRVN
jgi:hypothetical protein